MLKRKLKSLKRWLAYQFSCLNSPEHSAKAFRRDYKLIEEIGQGGFGVVYSANRIKDGMPVAVKFIRHKHVREWSMLHNQRIPSEICHLKTCENVRGTVKLIDWFASSKRFYIVMERPSQFMDLFDMVSVYGNMDEIVARKLINQLVETVTELYQKHSLIHRDIKDENVVVDMDTGDIMLVDFGAVEYFYKAKENKFQGTKLFCPPEWFKRKVHLPLESTVWAIGVLLYVLVTGSTPFHSEVQICMGRLRFPDHISHDCKSLLLGLLNPSPEKRMKLDKITSHKWMREEVCGPPKQQPFYTMLHRRLSTVTRNSDYEEEEEEEECSYRQSSKSCSPKPISMPQNTLFLVKEESIRLNTLLKRQHEQESFEMYESAHSEMAFGMGSCSDVYYSSDEMYSSIIHGRDTISDEDEEDETEIADIKRSESMDDEVTMVEQTLRLHGKHMQFSEPRESGENAAKAQIFDSKIRRSRAASE